MKTSVAFYLLSPAFVSLEFEFPSNQLIVLAAIADWTPMYNQS